MNLRKIFLRFIILEGVDKYPLTAEGQKQAQDLISFFSRRTIDVVYSSPFLRCRQTIAPLCEDRHITPHIDERISELDVGNLDSTPWRLSWTPDRRLTDTPL